MQSFCLGNLNYRKELVRAISNNFQIDQFLILDSKLWNCLWPISSDLPIFVLFNFHDPSWKNGNNEETTLALFQSEACPRRLLPSEPCDVAVWESATKRDRPTAGATPLMMRAKALNDPSFLQRRLPLLMKSSDMHEAFN